jgi:hypothetical protein
LCNKLQGLYLNSITGANGGFQPQNANNAIDGTSGINKQGKPEINTVLGAVVAYLSFARNQWLQQR